MTSQDTGRKIHVHDGGYVSFKVSQFNSVAHQ